MTLSKKLIMDRHKKLFIFIIFFASSSIQLSAQVYDYAREVVNTLASDEYKGRGYVENGDKLAADYIRNEFKKFGLKSFSNDYYQVFETAVNTFPTSIKILVNGKSLIAGKDFLIEPGSGSLNGSFEVLEMSPEDMLTDQGFISKLQQSVGKFIVVNPYDQSGFSSEENQRINSVIGFLKYDERNPASGLIQIKNEKLTWSGSTQTFSKPTITISSESISSPVESFEIDLANEFIENYRTQNVTGYVEGTSSDSTVVFIAHYDHLGMLGSDAIFNGANDNASGTAMLLSLAKHYSQNQPEYNTVFIAFGAEELGLIGSKYFTENPLFDLSSIKFLINFDLAGTGDEGIQVVNGSVYKDKFDLLTSINKENSLVPEVKIRGEACNSDHCMFDQKDVPGFYIYTLGGIKAYHDVYDRPETLPLTEFEDYFSLIIEFVNQL